MNSRAGTVLAVVVGALVLLAVVAGVVSATRDSPPLPEGSPEATVQDYVSRIHDQDAEGAAALLDPEDGCTADDLATARPDPARVVLRDTRVSGDTATVRVELVHGDTDLLGGGEWTEEETFRLRQVDGRWLITGDPWPVYGCLVPGKG